MNEQQLQSMSDHLATVVMGWERDVIGLAQYEIPPTMEAWVDLGQECDSPKFIMAYADWRPRENWEQWALLLMAMQRDWCVDIRMRLTGFDVDIYHYDGSGRTGSYNQSLLIAGCLAIARATGWEPGS